MKVKKIYKMGMELEQWKHKSCVAEFGVGDDWATLYYIESQEKGKGHATDLLIRAKMQYQNRGKKFGGSVALNQTMKDIYKRLGIEEY